MSRASEWATTMGILERQKIQAHLEHETKKKSPERPSFTLARADYPERPRTIQVGDAGAMVWLSANEANTYIDPAEAVRFAVWILQTFTECEQGNPGKSA